jgi:hypothetical protein
MPRRRPAQLREDTPARFARPVPHLPGVPKAALHSLLRWEQRHLWPGAVAEAHQKYRRHVNQPGRLLYGMPGGVCPCCIDYYGLADDPCGILEVALAQLSRRDGRALRRMVAALDDRLQARSLPDPWAPPEWPWWRRRCLW